MARVNHHKRSKLPIRQAQPSWFADRCWHAWLIWLGCVVLFAAYWLLWPDGPGSSINWIRFDFRVVLYALTGLVVREWFCLRWELWAAGERGQA